MTLCAMTLPAMAFGHGHLWYDRNAHVPQFGKLVIFPIVDLNGTYYYNNDDVESEPYKLNHYLNTRFIRKLDIKNTIALGDMINENRKVRTKDELEYPKLLESFSTEQERAAAVDSITGAPGYFIPRVRDVRTEPHMSPATTVRVQMQSYTTETGGPKGNRTYNKRTWTVNHTIPAKQLCLYHMDVEHALYNRKGEKILTYENNEHSYKYSSNKYVYDMFKSLTDEFKDDYKDIRKEYMDDKKNPRANGHVKIGFKEV
ncbi:MAG: hypothetical protein IJT04_02440, partial [Bacteroidales bacterium]|nr:hypothetical protein [Bacteroidales bacterium]